jgi:O-Antigen ligase
MATRFRPSAPAPHRPPRAPRVAQMPVRGRPASQSMAPVYVAVTLLYLLFIPEQFNARIGGVYLPPFRIFMLGAMFYLLVSAMGGRLRFAWSDLFVVLAAAWIWLASYMTSGLLSTAAIQGGAHTLDIAFAYFLARAAIQTPRDFRLFLVLIAPGIAIVSAIIVQESLTHVRLLQPLASELTGVPNRLRDDLRLGLMRGAGPFPHPILAGLFLASFLPLYLASGIRGWPKYIGLAGSFGAFFTMSSAALLGLLMGGVLWVYDQVTERIRNVTWKLFLAAFGSLFALIEFTSNSGFYGLMVRYASLQTTSAYNRVLIWKYGTENIAQHPLFGLGYADWVRPSWMHSGSFDHFWLILALRFGIPVSLFLIAATAGGAVMLATQSSTYRLQDARLLRGIAISLCVFALGAVSVSLWLAVLVWFFMLLGISVSLGTNLKREVPHAGIRVPPGSGSEDLRPNARYSPARRG